MPDGGDSLGNGGGARRAGDIARARGALLGLAVGDAFGTTLEFSEPRAPRFPALARGPHVDIVGDGPFRVAPGQVTDDTQLACCLASSIAERGAFDAADVARRYVAWIGHAFDVGQQTAAALNAIREGAPPHEAGRKVWIDASRPPAGNGSLMRTAPIGVLLASDGPARLAASLEESAITHYDPRCRLACAAFNAAVAAGVLGASGPHEMLHAARQEAWAAAIALRAEGGPFLPRLASAVRDVVRDLQLATRDDPRLYGPSVHLHRHMGFVRVAFRLAFWELLHAPTWHAGVLDAVNRGGDADTNGAITGALLGALHGEDAIPPRWREKVLGATPASAALATEYHPRALLASLGGR